MDELKYIIDQMNYEIFLAEDAMNISMRQLAHKAKYVTEAADMVILNESVIEVIKKYIKKVADAIQKAWNTFKTKIDYKVIHFIIDNNKKYLESDFKMKLPTDFEYPELNEWNKINEEVTVGDNILNAGSYGQMSEYLESVDKFFAQYYNNYVEQENGQPLKFTEVFTRRCFSKADDNHVMDKAVIGQYKDFLLGYKDQVELIQSDIDAINEVSQNIDSLLRQIGVTESTTFIGDILLEADDDQNKFRNADPNAEDKKQNNSKDRQNIVTYYKAMTQILTAKMRTCNKVKSNALRVVTNFVRLQGGLVKLPDNLKKKEEG